jgi:hypothetical protein
MSTTDQPTGATNRPCIARYPLRASVTLAILSLAVSLCLVRADEKEDEYLRIYDLVQAADKLNTTSKSSAALEKYKEALVALRKFKVNHPEWNVKTVSYRLNYLSQKIATLSAPPAAPETNPSSNASNAGPPSESTVKLLAPGAEPRKALRLHPKPGDKQTLETLVKIAMNMKMGQTENPPMKMPGMKFILELTTKDVSSDGDITYENQISDASVVEEPGVMPQMAEAMKSAMESIKGSSGTATVSSRGLDKGSQFKMDPNADPQANQAMEQMKDTLANISIPFPEEPIGPGAKWEAQRKVKSQGMMIDQTTAYELVSLEGERATLKNTITEHAANQKIENPTMPGIKVDLTKLDGTGKADLVLDLTRVLPSSGNIDSQTDMIMGMNLGPQKQDMTLKLGASITLESK